MNLSDLRINYMKGELDEQCVHPDPIRQFDLWMSQALESGIEEPTAMTLATVSGKGMPSARMVLLKGLDDRGFVFFTNYQSRKASELENNSGCALIFFWKELERQVRIEGLTEKISARESDEYFRVRPMESRISAVVSPQSKVISSREYLEKLRADYLENNPGEPARPEHWGGYRVIPEMIEFWQGRPNRLHDRIRYARIGTSWIIERLAP